MEFKFKLNKGPAASNTYVTKNDIECGQLTLDWSYDAIYFKYNNEKWITIKLDQVNKDLINTDDKKKMFKSLSEYTITHLKDYSKVSNKALKQLSDIIIDF